MKQARRMKAADIREISRAVLTRRLLRRQKGRRGSSADGKTALRYNR